MSDELLTDLTDVQQEQPFAFSTRYETISTQKRLRISIFCAFFILFDFVLFVSTPKPRQISNASLNLLGTYMNMSTFRFEIIPTPRSHQNLSLAILFEKNTSLVASGYNYQMNATLSRTFANQTTVLTKYHPKLVHVKEIDAVLPNIQFTWPLEALFGLSLNVTLGWIDEEKLNPVFKWILDDLSAGFLSLYVRCAVPFISVIFLVMFYLQTGSLIFNRKKISTPVRFAEIALWLSLFSFNVADFFNISGDSLLVVKLDFIFDSLLFSAMITMLILHIVYDERIYASNCLKFILGPLIYAAIACYLITKLFKIDFYDEISPGWMIIGIFKVISDAILFIGILIYLSIHFQTIRNLPYVVLATSFILVSLIFDVLSFVETDIKNISGLALFKLVSCWICLHSLVFLDWPVKDDEIFDTIGGFDEDSSDKAEISED